MKRKSSLQEKISKTRAYETKKNKKKQAKERHEFMKKQELNRKYKQSSRQFLQQQKIQKMESNVNRTDLPKSERKKYDIGLQFEHLCASIQHQHCLCCRKIGLRVVTNKRGVCVDCSKYKDIDYYKKKQWLPIWYDGNEPKFQVPDELATLTLAEKMLIQLASPFIPLQHIKNGTFGLSGHVCCFEQDVETFVNTLPRKHNDVTVLKVFKVIQSEIGSTASRPQEFKVRKCQIGKALLWLKRYNEEYKHIQIDMTALDWLVEGEGYLDNLLLTDKDDVNLNIDYGPNPSMTKATDAQGDTVKAYGYINDGPPVIISPSDTTIHNEILQQVQKSEKKEFIRVQWPSTGPIAISEYSSARIFTRAFPWLFPGGIGDIKDFNGDIGKWGENMLLYEDGRFTADKFFCFFALNYITRYRNASSGNWFIRDFNKGGPKCLDDLKESIRQGDLRFVNRLVYFNKRIKGSTSYWFQKRNEVYTWINHHVEKGNGPPLFFITLTCAEYYWHDLIRLLRERLKYARDKNEQHCFVGSPKLSQILNDYSVVVQEYFQLRFEAWMNTCGKEIFGIEHWWGRFEFTPGRGQIHIHFLAIRKDQTILKLCHSMLKEKEGKNKRDQLLANWAHQHFGLTALVDDGFDDLHIPQDQSPCSIRLSDVPPDSQHLWQDNMNLIKFCQVHDCNGFCLRKKNSIPYVPFQWWSFGLSDKQLMPLPFLVDSRRRYCRCGAGQEATKDKGDTPGFPLRTTPAVHSEHQKCLKLYMPRNHRRINQTSTALIQSWRANCDIQILIYESTPDAPDLKEISKVTDYVVAYSCKGNATLLEEIQTNKNLILGSRGTTSDENELKRLCKQLMNKAAASRLIPKAEASVLLANLDLTTCSEYIEPISISNSTRLTLKTTPRKNHFLQQYQHRPIQYESLSLHAFYQVFRSTILKKRQSIPHYIGVAATPVYPITNEYARHVLVVYKPWRTYPSGSQLKAEFESFIRSPSCPLSARLTYDRVIQRFYDKTKFVDPKASLPPLLGQPLCTSDEELLLLTGLSHSDITSTTTDLDGIHWGEDFPWDQKPKIRTLHDPEILPETWLEWRIKESETASVETLSLPKNHAGQHFSIDTLYDDQKFILYHIVYKIHQWLHCKNLKDFQPLRCTIMGQGGSGKSVLLNTITSVLRRLFQRNDVVKIACPTGTAAFNAHGETLHRLTLQGINSDYIPNTLSSSKRKILLHRFQHLLCLIIDERSLLTSKLLGSTAQIISETIFHGSNIDDLCGGLPVLILAGDDYQLPGMGEGAFQSMTGLKGSKITQKGRDLFLQCSRIVFQLSSNRRVNDNKQDDKEILARLRTGEDILDSDLHKLQSLHLNNIKKLHGPSVVQQIEQDAIYLFYTNEKRSRHNLQRLVNLNSTTNPTAIVKSTSTGNKGKAIACHFTDDTPQSTMLCVGSVVSIQGCNFQPLWGLHNGACGTVQEIIYGTGRSPISGNQPEYVIVRFPLYVGPPWDTQNPKDIPIPTISVRCKSNCCSRTFLPLDLSFARTIHKFQGLQAGPVDIGKPPNVFQTIVCDPDDKSAETRAPGLLYTAVSRATTLGDAGGLGSALYFIGHDISHERVIRINYKTNTDSLLVNVQRRTSWVQHLQSNTVHPHNKDLPHLKHILHWASSTTLTYDFLYLRTQQYILSSNHHTLARPY